MTLLFAGSVIFIVYTYALYPLIIWWMARSRQNPDPGSNISDTDGWPSVSVVVAVHNEEENIRRKLDNLSKLDYAGDLEIVVVSDGSTDGTNQFLATRQDIVFQSYEKARGKPSALNTGLEAASGEVIVYMDARQTVSETCIRELVKYFRLPDVGAVSGELVMTNGKSEEAENIGLYWRYEKWIRSCESRVCSTAGATGAIYAARRSDYVPLRSETLLDDFETPIATLKKGKRTLFEPAAVAYDRPSENIDDEFRRKARTLAGNFQSFMWNTWLFNPTKNAIFIQFLSHKVFRLLVPYAMLLALLSSCLADNIILTVFFWLQIVFYAVGTLGFFSDALSKSRLISFIKVFLQMNFAAVVGLYNYLFNRHSVRWKST